MNTAYLLLGSNEGNRQAILQQAIILLAADAGVPVQCSKIYETAAWGNTLQPAFLNQAVQLQTVHAPHALLSATQAIERRMGRQRIEKWGQRTLDIDLLFYNDLLLDTPSLRIPHPEMTGRRFVLEPLCDIAPSLVHPGLKLSVRQLLQACTDPLEVSLYKEQ